MPLIPIDPHRLVTENLVRYLLKIGLYKNSDEKSHEKMYPYYKWQHNNVNIGRLYIRLRLPNIPGIF